LSRRVLARKNIELLSCTTIRRMTGNSVLQAVELENTKTGERRIVETPAVFSMIGATPCTDWLPPEIARDNKGFVNTGTLVAADPMWASASRSPAPLETSLPGIFAAGDVRSGSVKRCAAAVGEGSTVVAGVHEALREGSGSR
jgi:thioredoxin reductase (NADPH)